MNTKSLTSSVIGLAVVIICTASLLMPTLNETVEANVTTYENEGDGLYYEIDPGDDRIVITQSTYGVWTLNGENYSVSSLTGGKTLLSTDTCRVTKSGNFVSLYDATGVRVANINGQSYQVSMTYDYSAKTFTWIDYSEMPGVTPANTFTYTANHLMLYNPSGDYVAYTSDGVDAPNGYYINDTSQIIAGGAYTTGALDTSYFAQGETVTVGVSDYTASATVTTTDVINEVITGSDYTVTVTDGTTTETFIPYTIYVPKEVVGHTSEQIAMNSLYGVIPIVLIAAIVLASVSFVMTGRHD